MAGRCKDEEFWDALIRRCFHCRLNCHQQDVIAKCTSFCRSALCEAKPGHYYDRLVKACIRCGDVCGRHPAECSQHCPTLPPPVITKRLLVDGTTQVLTTRAPRGLEDSAVLLYSLLAVCMVLLFSSLSLALIVFLRGNKAKSPTKSSTGDQQKPVVKPGHEFGLPHALTVRSAKGLPTSPGYPTYREPSDDSSPTETCACVHCFPDLRAFGQDNGRPQKAQYSMYPQGILNRPQTQKGGSVCVVGSLHGSGIEIQEGGTMG